MLERRLLLAASTDSSKPAGLIDVGGTVYFSADDGVHGPELWKSDGTAAGTVMVKDIVPGGVGSQPTSLIAEPAKGVEESPDGDLELEILVGRRSQPEERGKNPHPNLP